VDATLKDRIPISEPDLSGKELEYAAECVRSGWISSLGAYVTRFESSFASFCGARHGVATANGTAAIHLALVALGIKPGDEVIVPTLTFVASANAVTYTGARPVFADSDAATWTISPQDIERKIGPRTRAVLVVHLYGHPVDMAPILDIARKHKLWVIEDAAEAHGTEYRGRRVGNLGDVGTFSFYGNKTITTGEGGMIVTDDDNLRARLTLLRDQAMSPERRYWHDEIGFNYRLTNLQAAIGVAQLERIETFLARKRAIARCYADLLADVPGLTLAPEAPWAKSSFWMYTVLVEDGFPLDRDRLAAHLAEQGIDTRPVFHPMHTLPPYRAAGPFPVAENLARRGINLPSSVRLTDAQIQRVAGAIRSAR